MKARDVNHQKMTGEWHKHVRKRLGFKRILNKRRRKFFKKIMESELN
jgi:hypothetical protein